MEEKRKNKDTFKTFFRLGLFLSVVISVFYFIFSGPLPVNVTQAVAVDYGLGTTLGLGTADLVSTVINIIKWFLGILGLIAVVMILYGGFIWITAAGNTEKVAKAKKIIIRAVIGLIIVLLSWAIVMFIVDRIGKATSGGSSSCTIGAINGCNLCIDNGAGVGVWQYQAAWAGCSLAGSNAFYIKWVDPAENETNIPLCSIIQARFNADIDPASVAGNAHLRVSGGAANGTACANNSDCASQVCNVTCQGDEVAGTWQANPADGKMLEFLPNDDYLDNTTYQVSLTAGGIDDAAHTLDPFLGKSWNFTTGTLTLSTPPTVTAIFPADAAADICLNTAIQAQFSSKMRVASINTNTVEFTDVTAGGPASLKSPFSYPNPKMFSTRPQSFLTAGDEYNIMLIAGTPGSNNTDNGIMDVCLNHLDGNYDTIEAGSAGGDDFMSINGQPTGGEVSPWNFFADSDTTNTQCLPEITSINPNSRRYDEVDIAITGSNFGIGGNIIFTSQVNDLNHCFDGSNFPNQNCVSSWTGNSINVRVPGGPAAYYNAVPSAGAKDGGIYVDVAGDSSNKWSFDVSSPQIKKASGLNSQPHGGVGQYVTIYKRSDSNAGFGDIAGRVFFRKADGSAEVVADVPPDPPCKSIWNDNYVIIKVNDLQADLGIPPCPGNWLTCVNTASEVLIQVEKSGGIRSNLTKFIYTSETAGPGLCEIIPNTCGTNGDNRSLVGENFGNAVGSVNFTLNPNPPVAATVTNWTDQDIDVNVPNLDNSSDPYDVAATNAVGTSNALPFTVPCGDIPRVVEDSSCDTHCNGGVNNGNSCTQASDCPGGACVIGMASPNPYKGSNDVCTNAVIAARFTVAMNPLTLTPANIKFYECTDNTSACATTNEILGSTITTFPAPEDDRFTLTPPAILNTDQYYKVVISKEVESSPPDPAKMNNDYIWVFKTKNNPAPCPLEKVMVSPGNATIVLIPGNQNFVATPMGADCTLVNANDYIWAWSSDDVGVATVTGAVVNTETATSVAKGITYINAQAEGKKGRGRLKVDPESCAFNPSRCADPNNDGINECPGSTCDIFADRCMPVINSFAPGNGPAGQTITVNGCWFGNAQGDVLFGANPGIFQCANPWNDKQIVVTEPGNALGSYLIDVHTSFGRCAGGTNSGEFCNTVNDCPDVGGSCDNFSTAVDSAQNGAGYQFSVTGVCSGLCSGGANNLDYCSGGADCDSGICSPGVMPPVGGPPGVCPPLVPLSGKEGTDIKISGYNFNPLGINTNITRVYYSEGKTDTWDDIVVNRGGIWSGNSIDTSKVPVGSQTGEVAVEVNNCPSNAVNFGISCSVNSDCSTGCCKLDAVLGQKVCQEAAQCSSGNPGEACQIPANIANNGTCDAGPTVPAGGDYRCIDSASHLDPTPPASQTYPPAGVDDCTVCCDPDQNNNGNVTDDPMVSSTGLKCTPDVGNCTAPNGNERGLYCGCINDSQCGNPAIIGCGLGDGRSSHCCYSRPEVSSTNPPVGFTSMCTNFTIEYIFSTGSPNLLMDNSTIKLGTSVFVRDGGGNNISGRLTYTRNGFIFIPDSEFPAASTIWIYLRKDLIKDKYGIAMSNIAGDTDSRNWATNATAAVCHIDHLAFTWEKPLGNQISPPSVFTCAVDGCAGEPDAWPGQGNEQSWHVFPQDKHGVNIFGNINMTWSEANSNGIYDTKDPADAVSQCPAGVDSLNCFLHSLNKAGLGYWTVTADGTANGLGKVSESARVYASLCEKPWPDVIQGEPIAFEDSVDWHQLDNSTGQQNGNNNFVTNFRVSYCRDGGNLPILSPPEISPVGNNTIDNNGDEVLVTEENPGRVVFGDGVNSMLKMYFFPYRKVCIPDESLDRAACIAAHGADAWARPSEDAIGIRVQENEGGKSPWEWYYEQFGPAAPEPQSLTVDGYPAVRAGRTVYVSVPNLVCFDAGGVKVSCNDPLAAAGSFFPNIYLIAYNEGASKQTIDIYNKMLANWTFNVNMDPGDKELLRRDMKRLNDLGDIYKKLLSYKDANGHFPLLKGGSYVVRTSTSKWPSWQETLASTLGGGDLPIDPLNKFDQPDPLGRCTEGNGFDLNTCWNEGGSQFVSSGGVGDQTHIYQYIVADSGEAADLYANLEYRGLGSPINFVGDPCAGLPNSGLAHSCQSYNYKFNATGTIADNLGPIFNTVGIWNGAAITAFAAAPVLAGDLTVAADLTDQGNPASGVDKVEFYLDNILQQIDDDGTTTPAWSWDFDTTRFLDKDYTLKLRAYDMVGNWTDWERNITISNGGPPPSAPTIHIFQPHDNDTVTGTIVMRAVANDDSGFSSLNFIPEDESGNLWQCGIFPFIPNGLTSQVITVSIEPDCVPANPGVEVSNGRYKIVANVADLNGNTASDSIWITVDNPDVDNPTVNFVSVCPNSINNCSGIHNTIDHKVSVVVNATDPTSPIDRVEIYADNNRLGTASSIGGNQYEYNWDTLSFSNGDYTLRAIAYDTHGNYKEANLAVTIFNPENDTEPPTVNFAYTPSPATPASGSAVSGVITIRAVADDNLGVRSVNLYVDYLWQAAKYSGACTDGISPDRNTCEAAGFSWQYIWTFDTSILLDGWHSIQVDALDSAGNRSESIETRIGIGVSGGPIIANACVGPSSGVPGDTFTFYAEASDSDSVQSVMAYVQSPDETNIVSDIPMPLVSGNSNNGAYQGSWQSSAVVGNPNYYTGSFYVDIVAKDALGNSSELENVTGLPICGVSVCNNNGICDPGENNANCPVDCPPPPPGSTIYAGYMNVNVVYKSTDGGATWNPTGNLPCNGGIYSLIDSGGVIYTGSSLGEVCKSTDGGITWNKTGDLPGDNFIYSLAVSGGDIYAGGSAATGGHVYKSTDAGQSWNDTGNLGNSAVYSLLASGGDIYAGTGFTNGNVYKTANGGITWSNTANLAGAGDITSLLASGGDIYAGDSGSNKINPLKSSNGGSTWNATGNIPSIQNVTSLAEYNGTIYVGISDIAGIGRVYKSTDGGATWNPTGNLPGASGIQSLLVK